MTPSRDDRVFLVRMWRESDPTGQNGWRGSIHDVASGRRHYVTTPIEVSDFIDITLRREPAERPANDDG